MTLALLERTSPPARDDATRRHFLAGLSASVLLTACGSAGRDGGGTVGARTRTVNHPRGSIEVPERASRVVTLSEAIDGHLASVGLAPVGAADGVADWLVLTGGCSIPASISAPSRRSAPPRSPISRPSLAWDPRRDLQRGHLCRRSTAAGSHRRGAGVTSRRRP